jgi:hypothetical protein
MKKANYLKTTIASALAALGACAAPAQAVEFGSAEKGVTASLTSTISYGIAVRNAGMACDLIGNDHGGCNRAADTPLMAYHQGVTGYANADFNYSNFDAGNLNYRRGDIVSAVIKGSHELSLALPGGWSAFGRAVWARDSKIDDARNTPLSSEARRYATSRADLLDLWVAKSVEFGEHKAKFKLGNQVISWGEDIFILGGINQINALDLRAYHTPGTQLKEVFVPAPMLSFGAGLSSRISVDSYYQWAWSGAKFDAPGTFFSNYNIIGKGNTPGYYPTSVVDGFFGAGTCAAATPTGKCGDPATSGLDDASLIGAGLAVPFGGERRPRKGGQYGLALRYQASEIDTEFAFYYQRYHDKFPFLGFEGTLALTSYSWNYGQDKDLFGVSLNTKLGPVAVGAELSYRPRDSVGVDPTVPFGKAVTGVSDPNSVYEQGFHPGFVDEKKWQAHLTGFYTFSPNDPLGGLAQVLGASDGVLLGEMAVTRYPQLDLSGAIPYALPNYTLPTRTSWGYVLELGLNYPNVWGSGVIVTPQLDWAHDVRGTSPNALPFVQGRRALTASLLFNYRDKWRGALQMTNFTGGGDNNLLRDRDFVGANLSYTF